MHTKPVFDFFSTLCDNRTYTVDNVNYFTHPNDDNFSSPEDNTKILSKVINFMNERNVKNLFHFIPTECTTDYLTPAHERNSIDYQVVIDFDNELEKLNKNFYVVVGAYETKIHNELLNEMNLKRFKLLYWPTYLIQHTLGQLKGEYLDGKDLDFNGDYNVENWNEIVINKNFKKLYIHFNGKPRIHRLMVMDLLVKQDLFDLGDNSWNCTGYSGDILPKVEYIPEYWKEEIINLDDYTSNTKKHTDEFSDKILNPNCLFNLVGETSMDVPYVTEKIFRCLFIKQPFIAYGAKGMNKEILNYGFKLFDNIIDYSFDDIDEPIERFDKMLQELKKFKDLDYNELYNKMEDVMDYNKNRLFEILKNDTFIPEELQNLYENRN
jgi:hypothetical protein